jgi:DNA-binding MarR family transcriptional regulator
MEPMERSVPYLIQGIVARIERAVNKRARAHGLRIEEIHVLFRLFAKDYQTVKELAVQTGIEPSTLSRLLVRMQRKALVRKRRQSADNRAIKVSLTDKGRKLAQARQPTFREYESVILRGFSAEDAKLIKAALVRMTANAEEI